MENELYTVRIEKIIRETPDTITAWFENPDPQNYRYLSGQYMKVQVEIEGETVTRAYSYSSSPVTDDMLSITVKSVDKGLVSTKLNSQLKAGETLLIGKAQGEFFLSPDKNNSRHYVFLCAGSGITPLYSMMKTILAAEPKSRISLFYGSRREDNVIFREPLTQMEHNHKVRLTVCHSLSQPSDSWTGEKSRVNPAFIRRVIGNLMKENDGLEKSFWLCGPGDMVVDAENTVLDLGVPQEQIHKELFTKTKAKSRNMPGGEKMKEVKVIYDNKEHLFMVPQGQSILDASIKEMIDLPYSCQTGVCGSCRAKLVSGDLHVEGDDALSDEEIDNGYVLVCQSHPKSDGVVLDYEE